MAADAEQDIMQQERHGPPEDADAAEPHGLRTDADVVVINDVCLV